MHVLGGWVGKEEVGSGTGRLVGPCCASLSGDWIKARSAVSLGTCGEFTRSAAGLNFHSRSGICGVNWSSTWAGRILPERC